MRWIMVCLLVLNVAYLGWGLYQKPAPGIDSLSGSAALPPLKGKKLELISETRMSKDGSKPPPSLVAAMPGVENELRRDVDRVSVSKTPMCTAVGPVASREEGDRIVQGLTGQGFKSTLHNIELSRDVQYWVMLPSYNTRREALRVLRQLQSKKIDSYLIETGDLKNGISLGLFSKESSAAGIQDKIKEVGFAAEVRQKVRIMSEFWVRILPGQALENLQKTLQSLVTSASGAKISKASCEMFALSK